MKYFSSSSTHKIDAKGRVSIPASFRKVLEAEEDPTVVLIPRMHGEPAIEGLTVSYFNEIQARLDALNPLLPTTRALKRKLIAPARHQPLEDTGRIALGRDLIEIIDRPDQALFVGMGRTFQIWNPEVYAAMDAEMDELALQSFHLLPQSSGA